MKELKKGDIQGIIPEHAGYLGQLINNGYKVFYEQKGPYAPLEDRQHVWSVYEFIGVESPDGNFCVKYSRNAVGTGNPMTLDELKTYEWETRTRPGRAPRHISRSRRSNGPRVKS